MKLLDQVRHLARAKHFSYRTEKAYVYWIERYIRFHGIKHPSTMGAAEVEKFLTQLAVAGRVAASTQNQALGALLFRHSFATQHANAPDVCRLRVVGQSGDCPLAICH
jgi:hypothetical protein